VLKRLSEALTGKGECLVALDIQVDISAVLLEAASSWLVLGVRVAAFIVSCWKVTVGDVEVVHPKVKTVYPMDQRYLWKHWRNVSHMR
jgi:hypothetical protein